MRRALAAKLPASMMPAVITALDVLPVLPNGKVDRQTLQSSGVSVSQSASGGNALEELIFSLWTRQLPCPPASFESDFHLLGGDSLGLVEFLTEIGNILGRSVPIAGVPRPLTVAAMARMLEGGTFANAADPGIEIMPVTNRYRDDLRELLLESFTFREPMAAALQAEPSDLAPVARALLARCESEPFTYVAIERESGRLVGFCLGHDFAGPGLDFDARRDSRKLTPLFDLLAGLHQRYNELVRPRQGQVLEIAATGAAADADGYAIARALERRAFLDARTRGFERVVTLCTNAVTRYLALADQGSQLLAEVSYAAFEHEGRKVFAAAARHGGTALMEAHLT